MKDFKILGVDPGTNVLGYAILHVQGKELRVKDMDIMRLKHYDNHQTKLKEIFLQLQEIIEIHLPTILSIEAPFYGKNVQSMLKLGRAQGVCMAAAITMGLEIHEYSPKKIKMSVTGNGNAAKEQVAAMLARLTNLPIADQYLDATDALAAAYTHYNQLGGVQSTGKKYNSWGSFVKNNPQRKKS